ncbi:PEP-CTERM sorting domain-containing protein [Coraliomargarita sp. W4R53]
MKKTPLLFTSLLTAATAIQAQVIFQDTFDTSLTAGVNTDVNFEQDQGRQSGGTTTSTYTEQTLSGAGAFINTNANFSGDVLLLRTNYATGSARAAGVILDTDFSALAGTKYNIQFDGLISIGPGASTDLWMSFYMFDTAFASTEAATVNAAGTDLGILIRPDGRATIWEEGSVQTNFASGTTGIASGTVFNFLLSVDETLATPQATLLIDGNEIGTFNFDSETSNRFFGMRAQQGSSNGTTEAALADFRYDNLTITSVPEPSAYALFGGLISLGYLAIRRKR